MYRIKTCVIFCSTHIRTIPLLRRRSIQTPTDSHYFAAPETRTWQQGRNDPSCQQPKKKKAGGASCEVKKSEWRDIRQSRSRSFCFWVLRNVAVIKGARRRESKPKKQEPQTICTNSLRVYAQTPTLLNVAASMLATFSAVYHLCDTERKTCLLRCIDIEPDSTMINGVIDGYSSC